jgi:hypothetical protein
LTNEDSGEDENCEHKASKNEEIVSEKFCNTVKVCSLDTAPRGRDSFFTIIGF